MLFEWDTEKENIRDHDLNITDIILARPAEPFGRRIYANI